MLSLRLPSALAAAALLFASTLHAVTPLNRPPAKLDTYTRQTFELSMQSMDSFWDPATNLLRTPTVRGPHGSRSLHMVRETSWYAFGLLMRDAPGDREHAVRALHAVLHEQFVDPVQPWYGTFRRTPEEPTPSGSSTVMWRNYDPNWRVFIGTTFQMILTEFPDRIPDTLATSMYAAIDSAISGEMRHGRLDPSYSNIALMYGALWDFAAAHDNNPQWKLQSADWIEKTAAIFHRHNSFTEYNSPTYYGVDLFGLALWRAYGSTPHIRELGSSIESTLWTDIAAFYHPGLRNLAGPYDRSYGMDMENYVAVTGVWMRLLLPASKAPLPTTDSHTDHLADLWLAPLLSTLGAHPPAPALAQIRHLSAPHAVRRQITDDRTATAWIGAKAIYGGEITNLTKDAPPETQFHPATTQWRTPSGSIGWFYVLQSPMINAEASKSGLKITANGTIIFRLQATGTKPEDITATKWTLPGLTVTIQADNQSFSIKSTNYYQPNDSIEITYTDTKQMTLTITPD